MRVSRLYQDVNLEENTEFSLDARASHYVSHVLRLKSDCSLIIFNGRGSSFHAKVKTISKKSVVVSLLEKATSALESPLKIHLYQSVCRGDKMDFVIQKAVELGVSEITPMFTEHCSVKFDQKRRENRLAHWQQVMISACEQSGRSVLPELHSFIDLSDFKADSILSFVAHPKQSLSLSQSEKPQAVNLLVGPEGGFGELEMAFLTTHNVQTVCLGPRILRTETAGLVLTTIVQHLWGDVA